VVRTSCSVYSMASHLTPSHPTPTVPPRSSSTPFNPHPPAGTGCSSSRPRTCCPSSERPVERWDQRTRRIRMGASSPRRRRSNRGGRGRGA
jgi:hypothetical protein